MADLAWSFSHTQLDLWRTCKRKFHWQYVLGNKEPRTDNMAAGTWLVQEPVEDWEREERHADAVIPTSFELYYANFLAEFGGDDSYDSGIFTPDLPKKVLQAYKKSPLDGKVIAIEETFWHEFPNGMRFRSIPDLVVEQEYIIGIADSDLNIAYAMKHICWDIKLKTFNQNRQGDEFFMKPALSPLDDQGVSQAICAGADAFGQIQFWLGKKDGIVRGPFYLEHQLNPVLAEEWKAETQHECEQIATWRQTTFAPWPKNPDSCGKWGRVCPAWDACNFGFVGVKKY